MIYRVFTLIRPVLSPDPKLMLCQPVFNAFGFKFSTGPEDGNNASVDTLNRSERVRIITCVSRDEATVKKGSDARGK